MATSIADPLSPSTAACAAAWVATLSVEVCVCDCDVPAGWPTDPSVSNYTPDASARFIS
jgi:hypothetical protein